MRHILLAFFCLISPVAAQTPLHTLSSADEARAWQAVGRLNLANGASFCSATLVGERLVLTAAHCLFSPVTNTPYAPEDIEFQPGWRNGGAAAYRHARRYVVHPEFDLSSDDWAYRLARDIALIELDTPIRGSGITPLGWASHLPATNAVSVVSYAMDRQTAPALEEGCEIVARESGAMLLSCSAGPGASGAPVLATAAGEVKIVGMISAIAQWGGDQVSAGVEIGPAMALLTPLLEIAPGGIVLRPAAGGSIAEQLGRTSP